MPARKDQLSVPVAYVRGGSSKALFFHEHDIPPEGPDRDRFLKRAMGTPDPIQIDGMGGTKAVTSKIAIVRPSKRNDADIDYLFVQTGVKDDLIDYSANCGNISSGVGPFAIDEGLVGEFRKGQSVDPKVRTQEVRIFNTGTEKVLISHVPIDEDGFSMAEGEYTMAAVPGTGAPILMDYCETVGASRNRGLLPTGHARDTIQIEGKDVDISICDVANIIVFVKAEDMGVSGHETSENMPENRQLLDRVREVRGKAAQMVDLCEDWKQVDQQSPFMPMLVILSEASSSSPDAHVSCRLFLDNMCHPSMAGTGSCCTAACSRLEGSLVYDQVDAKSRRQKVFNISHPLGIIPIACETESETVDPQKPDFKTLSFIRTSRRIMDGKVYVPRSIFGESRWSERYQTNGVNGVNGVH